MVQRTHDILRDCARLGVLVRLRGQRAAQGAVVHVAGRVRCRVAGVGMVGMVGMVGRVSLG